MPSLLPEPYTVCHIPRLVSDELDPDTGNNVIVDLPAKIRRAQSISQIGRLRGSSKEIFSPDFVRRVETELHLSVARPDDFADGDQVLLFPEVDDNGDWIPDTGIAFVVDGVPYSGQTSPFPLWSRAFGGMVRLRRTT